MSRVILSLVLLFSVTTTIFAVDHDDSLKEHIPKLKIEDVIRIAKDYSQKAGYKLDDFFISKIEYDSDEKEWSVFFEGIVPIPGNHYWIIIEDRTNGVQLMPGE